MPKKLVVPKSKLLGQVKFDLNNYSTMMYFDDFGVLKYYQVQHNRKKIANYQDQHVALRRMMSEANYELQDLFNGNIVFL